MINFLDSIPPYLSSPLLYLLMHEAFESFEVIKGLKDKPESILVHANKLFIGDNHGSLSIHRLSSSGDRDTSTSSLIETRSDFNKNKKSIELLGIIKESNTLVSLSGQ